MPEEQDRKISYKILTAEELLKEEAPPAKEIEHKEEKIEIPVAQKIESRPEEIQTKKEEVKEIREVIESQKEAGLIYPGVGKEEKPIDEVVIEPSQKVEIPILKPMEIAPSETRPIEEEPIKEEIFYTPQKEKEIQFKPTAELLQKEVEKKEIPEPVSPLGETKREFKLPANLLKFVFLGGGIIFLFLLILFLKPQEKLKSIFNTGEEKKREEVKITTPTPTTISFPRATSSIQTITLFTETTSEISTSAPTTVLGIPTQPSFQQEIKPSSEIGKVFQEIKFLTNYSSKEITLKNLDFSNWQEEFKKLLSLQEFSGTKLNINFLYNKNKIPFDFLFDYFIKPTKISSDKIEEFKNNFTGSYGLLIYYGYTRKYPILIFEVKDNDKALKFNQEWEKSTIKEDLKTLFLGLNPPKSKNNFITKRQENYSYRILDLGDKFKIIWTIVDNYLIYSTTEMGVKDILGFLK